MLSKVRLRGPDSTPAQKVRVARNRLELLRALMVTSPSIISSKRPF